MGGAAPAATAPKTASANDQPFSNSQPGSARVGLPNPSNGAEGQLKSLKPSGANVWCLRIRLSRAKAQSAPSTAHMAQDLTPVWYRTLRARDNRRC
eukprot:1147851-Pelagomonas_calceolata.AAC.4